MSMRCLFFFLLFSGLTAWAQNSSTLPDAPTPQPGASQSSNSQAHDSNTTSDSSASSSKPTKPSEPDLSPPRSDSIPASALEEGSSSSKDTQVDLSAPADDAKAHPQGAEAVSNAEAAEALRSGDVSEFHIWDPHKAAKDVEVGDFYFRRKNYVAAEDRYREALFYKDSDAVATYRLAVCLEKMNRPTEARQEFESYLKILPYGPEAKAAHKAIDRLKTAGSTSAQ
jgi:tetratricopeptide (TPR) repeat protein